MRAILFETAAAMLLLLTLLPTPGHTQAQRVPAPSEAVGRLQAIATGQATPPVAEMVQAVEAGLQTHETRDASLLAVAGRGALPRFRPSPQSTAQWRLEKAALAALRPALLPLLSDESQHTRVLTVLAVATLGLDPEKLPEVVIGADALKVLRQAYQGESSAFVRSEIVKTAALCSDRDPARGDLLLLALRDPDPDVLAFAARGLGTLRTPEALGELASLLEHESRGVRLAAAHALSRHGANALPYLGALDSALSREQDEIVRKTLDGAISNIRKP